MLTLLAQTTTGAILEIIALLLIAGVIAWLTSYFYYRSIYRRKLAEKDEIIQTQSNRIRFLENENRTLSSSLEQRDKEILRLDSELDKANQELAKRKAAKN